MIINTVKGKKYKLDKNSQIKLDEIHIITKNHLQNYFYKLDNTDLNRVIKRYNILKEKNIHNLEIEKFEVFPEIGDVVLYNSQKYIIYQMDSNNIYLYKMIKANKNIKINTKNYDVIYNENLILKKTTSVHIVDFASEDQLDTIKLQKKQHNYEEKRLKKIKEELKIGRIIRFNNKDKVVIDIDNQNIYTIDLDLIYINLKIESYALTNKFKLKSYLNNYELKDLLKWIKKESKGKIKQIQNKSY